MISVLTSFYVCLFLLFTTSSQEAPDKVIQEDDIFMSNASVMLIIEPNSGAIIDANVAAVSYYGYDREILLSMNISQINTLSPEEIKQERLKALSQERNYFIFKHRLQNGTIRDVEVYSYPYISLEGDKLLLSTIYDITADIAEEALKRKARLTIFLLSMSLIVGLLLISILIYRNNKKQKSYSKEIKDMIQHMQEGFAVFEIISDKDGVPVDYMYKTVNKAFDILTGIESEKTLNKLASTVYTVEDELFTEVLAVLVAGLMPISFIVYSKQLNSHYQVSMYQTKPGFFVMTLIDLSTTKELEENLNDEQSFLKTALHSIGDGIIVINNKGYIKVMNRIAEQMTGWISEELLDKELCQFIKIYDDQNKHICEPSLEYSEFDNKDKFDHKVMMLVSRTGMEIPVVVTIRTINQNKLHENRYMIVIKDVKVIRDHEEEIRHMKDYDVLTNIYNRRFFESYLIRSDAMRFYPNTIAIIDINGLKLINDAFGFNKGNEVINKIVGLIQQQLRTNDIFARVGGDEFAILLPGTSSEDSERIVERIHKVIDTEIIKRIKISVSIGTATQKNRKESLVQVFSEAEKHIASIKLTENQSGKNRIIQAILRMLHEKSVREKIHSEHVSRLCYQIGDSMQLSHETLNDLKIAGLLHDIGKISVSEMILNKPAGLTEEEYTELKKHTESGYKILKTVDTYSRLAEYVLYHHEHWNGKGYPKGLQGEDIPFVSRIITVADAFEAMTADRPYRKGMKYDDAMQELLRCAGTQFDSNIVSAINKLYRQGELD